MTNRKMLNFYKSFELGTIGLVLLTVTWLHFHWMNSPMIYHAFLQFLYYVPVIYAAVRYGLKGGAFAAVAASTAFAVHMLIASSTDELIYQFMQVVLINFIGWVSGILSLGEKRLTRRYQELSEQKDGLISELELRNTEIAKINIELEHEMNERKTLQEWVKRNERLSAMGRLSAGVAHELRNPIGIIKTTMQILAEEYKDSSSVKECADVVIEECDRMNSVVGEFLKFARPAEPKLEAVLLADVVNDVMLFTEKYIQRQCVSVEKVIHEHLQPVNIDSGQIKQVLVNLIINAVDSMPDGGNLTITVFAEGKKQKVSLRDSGQGIPQELQTQIFEPFFSTKPRGVGLGLPIVYSIMENHNGSIEVNSEPVQGTEFVITFE